VESRVRLFTRAPVRSGGKKGERTPRCLVSFKGFPFRGPLGLKSKRYAASRAVGARYGAAFNLPDLGEVAPPPLARAASRLRRVRPWVPVPRARGTDPHTP